MIPEKIPTVLIDRMALVMETATVGKWVIQMELDFPAPLDPERLAKALQLMLDAEPVLGCRMVLDPKLPYWQRLPDAERKNFSLAGNESEYANFKNRGLDCAKGPQLQACLLRNAQSDKLLIKLAHQAGDAGGLKDVAAELSAIYNRLEKEPGFKPEPNLAGCRDFRQVMRQVPLRAYPKIFFNFLRQTWSNSVPAKTLQLPLPEGPVEPLTYVIRHIPAERTERIAQFGKAHNATINDVMVAAHYWALVREAAWDKKSMLRLVTTIDLRRWYLPDEKAEGICNLSVWEYPSLGRALGKDFAETVELVGRKTRARKENWIGLTDVCLSPVAKLLSFKSQMKWVVKLMVHLANGKTFPHGLTNMGEIKKESVFFGAQPSRVWLLPPFLPAPVFAGGLSGYQGCLTLCAGVSVHEEKVIARFYDSVLENLPV
jgi:NRPS condensation-like uncharacterized protein